MKRIFLLLALFCNLLALALMSLTEAAVIPYTDIFGLPHELTLTYLSIFYEGDWGLLSFFAVILAVFTALSCFVCLAAKRPVFRLAVVSAIGSLLCSVAVLFFMSRLTPWSVTISLLLFLTTLLLCRSRVAASGKAEDQSEGVGPPPDSFTWVHRLILFIETNPYNRSPAAFLYALVVLVLLLLFVYLRSPQLGQLRNNY